MSDNQIIEYRPAYFYRESYKNRYKAKRQERRINIKVRPISSRTKRSREVGNCDALQLRNKESPNNGACRFYV